MSSPPPGRLRALDVDGIAAVTLGTAVWAVLLVIAITLHSTLRRHGHLWWIAVAGVGFGLGLLGIAYCRRRAGRIRSQAASPASAPAVPAAGHDT